MTNITQFPIPALMMNQFSLLPSATLNDVIVVNQNNVTGTETLQQIFNLFLPLLFLNYAGNPNGHVAGIANQTCWDTTNQILYVCTVSGTISGAVWKAV